MRIVSDVLFQLIFAILRFGVHTASDGPRREMILDAKRGGGESDKFNKNDEENQT